MPRANTRRDIPAPGTWDRHAACADHPHLPWTRDRPTDHAIAAMKQVCRNCPVLADCAAYVAEHGGVGIMAAAAPKDRRHPHRGAA